MQSEFQIENIEAERQHVGIDDVELRDEIRGLKVGDSVQLTFMTRSGSSVSVPVRITQIRGTTFRGKLVQRALMLPKGKLVKFTIAHVHSVVKRPTIDK